MFDRRLIVPGMNRLSEYTAQEVEWLWPGRVPIGKVTMLCGDPGMGKSFICMDMAARVSAGLGWPEEEWEKAGPEERTAHASESRATGESCATGEPGSVLVMSAEDDPRDTLRPRVERAGGDLSRVVLLHSFGQIGQAGAWVPTLDENMDVIEKAVDRMEGGGMGPARLVVIDPVSAFLGRVNSYSNAGVRAVLDRLSDIAAARRVAMVCVTHLNKTAGVRAAYRVMGSLAFAASPRVVWRVAKLSDGRMGMAAVKSNVAGVRGTIAFRLEGGRVEWAKGDGAECVEVERTPGVVEAACRWLEEFLNAGPRGAAEVFAEGERAGHSVAALRRAKEVCGVGVRKEGKGWVWGAVTE